DYCLTWGQFTTGFAHEAKLPITSKLFLNVLAASVPSRSLLIDSNKNLAPFDLHFVAFCGPGGGHGQGGAGADIEFRAVTGAGDGMILQLSFTQRLAFVRADIVDGKDFARNVQ